MPVANGIAAPTLVDAYDEWHRNFDTETDPIDTPWHTMAIPHLSPLDGARVLEIGCGRGGLFVGGRGGRVRARPRGRATSGPVVGNAHGSRYQLRRACP